MTNPGLFGRSGPTFPTAPKGEVLGTYDTYPEAQSVVDRLAKSEFPVAKVTIIGNDLKSIERVTGRLTYGRAALAGALSGLWFGVFIGILFSLFSPEIAFTPIIAAALIGLASGLFFGLISYALDRRRRDFTSMTQVLASNYQVLVQPDLVVQAQETLARASSDG